MVSNQPSQKTGQKIIGIVDALDEHGSLGVTQLASELDIAKSTAHYHLSTLRDGGYVIKDGPEYQLSLRFLRFGERTRSQIPIYGTAKAEVDKLAKQTDELGILMVEEQGYGVYLHKTAGENAIDIDAPIGRFATLHNRALGQAILAHLPESTVETILDEHGLPKTTDQTIGDRDRLFEELEQVRAQQFATNHEESIDGLSGVAVPILGDEEEVLGAISIAGPSKRLETEKLTGDYADLLSKARNVIELTVQHGDFQQ